MKSLLLFLMLILTWSLVSIGTASADLADLGAVRPAKRGSRWELRNPPRAVGQKGGGAGDDGP